MDQKSLNAALEKVRSGLIPGAIYSDPYVFAKERESLFSRSWNFLAHESEIPNKNDYVVRNVLEDSFIVARGADSQVRVFLNICRHRGGQVCRNESGNTRRFVCPYHSWAFKTDGSLAGVPYHEEAYGGEEVLPKKDYGLYPAPRTEIIYGLVFVSLDPNAPPLEKELGEFKQYLQFYLGGEGNAEFRGPQRWRFKANWKIGAENFSGDTYHTPHTHASVGAIQLVSSAATSDRKDGVTFYTGLGNGATFRLGAGDFQTRMMSVGYPEEQIARMRKVLPTEIFNMIDQEGLIPSASTFFPNVSFLSLWAKIDDSGTLAPFTTIRLFVPISETETEMYSWFVVDAGASDDFKQKSYKAYVMCFGTSGMFEQDDMDAWVTLTRTTRGYMSGATTLHSQMGLKPDGSALREPMTEFSGPGTGYSGFNEHNQRAWLKTWADHLAMAPPIPPIPAHQDEPARG